MQHKRQIEVVSQEGVITYVSAGASPARTSCRVRLWSGGEVALRGFVHTPLIGMGIVFAGKLDASIRGNTPTYVTEIVEDRLPQTAADIERFLRACAMDYRNPVGRLEALTAAAASALVRAFGAQTLQVLDEPDKIAARLVNTGLNVQQVAHIAYGWYQARRAHRLHHHLRETYGFVPEATRLAVELLHKRNPTGDYESMVRADPYLLAPMRARFPLRYDRFGVEDKRPAFSIIDEVALQGAFQPFSPERLRARALMVLEKASGSTALPERDLCDRVVRDLKDVQAGAVQWAVDCLRRERVDVVALAVDGVPQLALTDYAACEADIARNIMRVARRGSGLFAGREGEIGRFIDAAMGSVGGSLHAAQTNALSMALTEKISVLTGGPGCGKTAVTQMVAKIAHAAGARVLAMAPTGRAAQRLAEGGVEAVTIAKALGADRSGQYTFHAGNRWDHDYYIIDEMSMLDVSLARAVFAALPDKAIVFGVGDVNQLASVKPGNVLGDLLGCGVLPVTRLTHPFRQQPDPRLPEADPNDILANAARILRGDMPQNSNAFVIRYVHDEAAAAERIVDLARNAVLKRGTFDGIQVISPQESGSELGCLALNARLQHALNPAAAGKPEVHFTKRWFEEEDHRWYERDMTFRVGDRVIQTRNDYTTYVMNGDIGVISAIADGKLTLTMDNRKKVEIAKADLSKLDLAYAITVHKAQGAGYREVLMPLALTHRQMLTKNLLFTAVTRAKSRVILVGMEDALEWAVSKEANFQRHSLLGQYLKNEAQLHYEQPSAPKYSYAGL